VDDQGDAKEGREGGSTALEPVAILVKGAASRYNCTEGCAC
jgi:hypothetical protein